MSDKIIKERGLSTITLPAPSPFSFDVVTRQQELVFYYQYCVINALITVVGEQSRTALIRKTFTNLGGTGDTADAAMISWLQGVLDSVVPGLYDLWLDYFTTYSDTPDAQGVTYAGLSVEAAYRKFLSDFIGDGTSDNPFFSNFTDPLLVRDNAVFKQGKIFADSVTMADVVDFLKHLNRSYSDSYSITDSMVFGQKKFFADSYTMSDAMLIAFRKVFVDTVSIADVATFVKAAGSVFNDSFALSDAAAYKFGLVKADSYTMSDAILYRLSKVFADTVTITDALTSTAFIFRRGFADQFDLSIDTVLFAQKKFFTDTVVISDSAVFGFGGYNSGVYNDGPYNR